MSRNTSITIVCSVAEEEVYEDGPLVLIERLSEWLRNEGFHPLETIEDRGHVAFVLLNHFDGLHEAVTEYFLSLPWKLPENTVMILEPEDGPSVVTRPDYYPID